MNKKLTGRILILAGAIVLFLILALCYVFHTLAQKEELIHWKPAMYAVTGGAVVLFGVLWAVFETVFAKHEEKIQIRREQTE